MIRELIKTIKPIVLLCAVWVQSTGAGAQGVNTVGTQSSLVATAYALRSAYNTQSMGLQDNLWVDANPQGIQDFSLGVLGRDTSLTGQPTAQSSSLVLVLDKRVDPQWRLGLYADQTVGTDGLTVANLGAGLPGVGAYGVWTPADNPNDVQIRLSAGWNTRSMTVQRSATAGAESGMGSTELTTLGYQLIGSMGIALGKTSRLRPYAGLRYVRVADRGYSESSAVSTPLSMGPTVQDNLAAMAGVQAQVPLTPTVAILASVGLEQDLTHQVGAFEDTSQAVPGLVPVALNTIYNPTRGVFSMALQAQTSQRQRLQLGVQLADQAFASQMAVQVKLGWLIGF